MIASEGARRLRTALLAEWSRDGSLTAVEHIDRLIETALDAYAAARVAAERERFCLSCAHRVSAPDVDDFPNAPADRNQETYNAELRQIFHWPHDLPAAGAAMADRVAPRSPPPGPHAMTHAAGYREQVRAAKAQIIRSAVLRHRGNRSAAARELGMLSVNIQRLIRVFGLAAELPTCCGGCVRTRDGRGCRRHREVPA